MARLFPRFRSRRRDGGAMTDSSGLGPAVAQLAGRWESTQVLCGRMAAEQARGSEQIDSLADVEFRVFSQFGEDGILEWLVHWIKPRHASFVEFGVENYLESNTRFLLLHRNWKGLVMDGSTDHMAFVRSSALHWRNDLTPLAAFVTAENIDELLRRTGYDGPLGLLSIDVDGNDYWILQAIGRLDCDILVVECNPVFGDRHAVTVPYDPRFERFAGHYSGLYFGASIAALRELAERRGYTFLGTCSNGINAFFVRDSLADRVVGRIRRRIAWPAVHRDSRDRDRRLSYTRGRDRFTLIADCPVHCCRTGRVVRLGDLERPYSDEWLEAMALPAELREQAGP
jgi:hypothetical protein